MSAYCMKTGTLMMPKGRLDDLRKAAEKLKLIFDSGERNPRWGGLIRKPIDSAGDGHTRVYILWHSEHRFELSGYSEALWSMGNRIAPRMIPLHLMMPEKAHALVMETASGTPRSKLEAMCFGVALHETEDMRHFLEQFMDDAATIQATLTRIRKSPEISDLNERLKSSEWAKVMMARYERCLPLRYSGNRDEIGQAIVEGAAIPSKVELVKTLIAKFQRVQEQTKKAAAEVEAIRKMAGPLAMIPEEETGRRYVWEVSAQSRIRLE